MAVQVKLIKEAVEDLERLAESGYLLRCLKKLLEIEEKGADAGLPLGGQLAGWRKLPFGDKNWRIIFKIDAEEETATVCVVGDREDGRCYEQAADRAKAAGDTESESFASVLVALHGDRKARRAARRKAA